MTTDEATKLVLNAYETQFGEKPDKTTEMAAKLAAPRIATGEKWEWKKQGAWKTLHFLSFLLFACSFLWIDGARLNAQEQRGCALIPYKWAVNKRYAEDKVAIEIVKP